jgi:hypothetical protein
MDAAIPPIHHLIAAPIDLDKPQPTYKDLSHQAKPNRKMYSLWAQVFHFSYILYHCSYIPQHPADDFVVSILTLSFLEWIVHGWLSIVVNVFYATIP